MTRTMLEPRLSMLGKPCLRNWSYEATTRRKVEMVGGGMLLLLLAWFQLEWDIRVPYESA